MMAIVPDQSILDALRGFSVESSKQPIPRLIKIYISSTKIGKCMLLLLVTGECSQVYAFVKLKSRICRLNLHTHVNNIYPCTEFKEERRILLEVIGPELQSIYDDRQIEV